ncbi:hypothetical protein BB560_001285 [Smittium megazygosporum]|uniref:CRIB domain-containing protein n=1 Tax=Smittium megazygosporum TaxID=133381 RepID=A0A2T9ZI16_9FUNG|nr:hypothetical protein BB560_001285 [Smittium megazygosporum]
MKYLKSSKMEIGLPYNTKHELHIGVDEINKALELLPETCKQYIEDSNRFLKPSSYRNPYISNNTPIIQVSNTNKAALDNADSPNLPSSDFFSELDTVDIPKLSLELEELRPEQEKNSGSKHTYQLENDPEYQMNINVDKDMIEYYYL